MLSSDQDSTEETATSAPNDAEGEEQEEESPADSDGPEEVGVWRADLLASLFPLFSPVKHRKLIQFMKN